MGQENDIKEETAAESDSIVVEEKVPKDVKNDAAVTYQTLANGVLSPRHRKLALLASQGLSNAAIAKELGYSDSRVSILLRNPDISAEIVRLQERIFEETVGARLKAFAEPALAILQNVLTDKTNRVKKSEQIDVAKWVVEKLDGKATQKHDIGENMLGVLMDRLDSLKNAGTGLGVPALTPAREVGEVTPQVQSPRTEEDQLDDWVVSYSSES